MVGHLEFMARRNVALAGPGLKSDLSMFEVGQSRNATNVQIWRLGAARRSVDSGGKRRAALRADLRVGT